MDSLQTNNSFSLKCSKHQSKQAIYISVKLDNQEMEALCDSCLLTKRLNNHLVLAISEILSSTQYTYLSNWPLFQDQNILESLTERMDKYKDENTSNKIQIEQIQSYFKQVLDRIVLKVRDLEKIFINHFNRDRYTETITVYNSISQKEKLKQCLLNVQTNKKDMIQLIKEQISSKTENQQCIQSFIKELDESEIKYNQNTLNQQFEVIFKEIDSIILSNRRINNNNNNTLSSNQGNNNSLRNNFQIPNQGGIFNENKSQPVHQQQPTGQYYQNNIVNQVQLSEQILKQDQKIQQTNTNNGATQQLSSQEVQKEKQQQEAKKFLQPQQNELPQKPLQNDFAQKDKLKQEIKYNCQQISPTLTPRQQQFNQQIQKAQTKKLIQLDDQIPDQISKGSIKIEQQLQYQQQYYVPATRNIDERSNSQIKSCRNSYDNIQFQKPQYLSMNQSQQNIKMNASMNNSSRNSQNDVLNQNKIIAQISNYKMVSNEKDNSFKNQQNNCQQYQPSQIMAKIPKQLDQTNQNNKYNQISYPQGLQRQRNISTIGYNQQPQNTSFGLMKNSFVQLNQIDDTE